MVRSVVYGRNATVIATRTVMIYERCAPGLINCYNGSCAAAGARMCDRLWLVSLSPCEI